MRLMRVNYNGKAWWATPEADHYTIFNSPDERRSTGHRQVGLEEAVVLTTVAPGKVVGVGRNYHDHIVEMGYEVPEKPSVFLKATSSLIGAGEQIVLPPRSVSSEVEHEAELAVVIGRKARNVPQHAVDDYVLGITIANDVSARDLQRQADNVSIAKGIDTFCPIGPWVVCDVPVDKDRTIVCTVNDAVRQDGSTDSMVFSASYMISYLTQYMTLMPGDVVLTGSPGGSASLVAGDEVRIDIEGIGTLHNRVVASPGE